MGILEWPFSAKASQHAETPLSCGMLMYREETSNGYLVLNRFKFPQKIWSVLDV